MRGTSPTPNDKIAILLQNATALHNAGRLEEAELAYQRVLKINPRDPDGLHLLGLILFQKGRVPEGVASIKKAIAVRDDFPDAHVNAAHILSKSGDLDGAIAHLRKAALYRPAPRIHCDIGNLLRAQGKDSEALLAFRAAMECSPRNAEGYVYYARALRVVNDFPSMLSVAQAGLKLDAANPTLAIIAAEAFFGLGRLKEGWHAYRARFAAPENRPGARNYPLPMWEGEELTDRSVLIWGEQAPGDEIMYANMFTDLARRAKRVVVQCSPRLAPLFRRSFPQVSVYDHDLPPEELQGLDYQLPAGSLGEWLRPTFDSFPDTPSYLIADAQFRDALRAKYLAGAPPNTALIGVSWKSMIADGGADKSLSLLEWGPILQIPGAIFVNLQYGDCALELQEASKGFRVGIINDPTVDPLRDMDGHAAQVAAMDVVVTSSNTTAHVAGALGVATICLLPRSLGRGRRWYWFAEHEKCPWYPKLDRVYRKQDGDWLQVIREAALRLSDIVAKRGTSVADYLHAMAIALEKAGRAKDAEAYYHRLALDAGRTADAMTALGDLRKAALDADGAFAFYDRALAAKPDHLPAYVAKASVLNRLNRFDEAIAVYEKALAHAPHSPALLSNLATSLMRLGRSEEALPHLTSARAGIGSADAYLRDSIDVNYSMALKDSGKFDEALAVLDAVIERSPDHVDAHYNRSQIRLTCGRLKEGWQEAEWRLKRATANVRYDLFPHVRRWGGEDLEGKRVLIWTEQGLGDEILIAGMVGDAIARAAHVTFLCSARLLALFRRSFPPATVDVRQEPLPASARDPRLDFQMSMADLGLAFRRTFESFPRRDHYLIADNRRVRALRQKYQQARPGTLLVGVAWSSHGNTEMGWLKSNNLEAWGPILQVPGITFVNLQYGDRSADLARVRELFGVDILVDSNIDPMGDMDDFAAQVRALDLVVSTSNTTVHFSGGLGIPTWVLAPGGRGRHWYWYRDREDSPWYPSLRFVGTLPGGGWESTIARCAEDLAALTRKKGDQS